MRLYLVQHAEAAPKEEDPERPLTEQGRKEIEKVAAFVKPLNLSVENLWHSGKKRAVQTAEALAKAIKIRKTLTARDGLGPVDDVTPLADKLASTAKDIMIVGHLPFLAKLASLLLTGSESAGLLRSSRAALFVLTAPRRTAGRLSGWSHRNYLRMDRDEARFTMDEEPDMMFSRHPCGAGSQIIRQYGISATEY